MSNINKGLFSCDSVEWSTPQHIYDELHAEFGFTLDPCCTAETAKCNKFYTVKDNGLSIPWGGEVVFMNPPYGREIIHWMRKAFMAYLNGAIVVCLVPARTDTKWWHCYAMQGEVRFIKGRIKFTRKTKAGHIRKGPAPFPSAVVILAGEKESD
jgi:site-specific DNA-methyltransferase (adenine-specific)